MRDRICIGDPIVPLDLWPALPKIACSKLVVRAAETDVLDLDVAFRMIENLPDGRLVEIERAEHLVFEDNPEDFIAALVLLYLAVIGPLARHLVWIG